MKRARTGFSVLEALIALTILTIMIGAILSFYAKGQQTFINESAQADAIEQTRYPLAWITRDVKLSTAIEASWGGYVTSADTLILRIPSVNASGLIIDLETSWDRVIYRIQGNRLHPDRGCHGRSFGPCRPDPRPGRGNGLSGVRLF